MFRVKCRACVGTGTWKAAWGPGRTCVKCLGTGTVTMKTHPAALERRRDRYYQTKDRP
jgi:DnaJ-class molecular chaperone